MCRCVYTCVFMHMHVCVFLYHVFESLTTDYSPFFFVVQEPIPVVFDDSDSSCVVTGTGAKRHHVIQQEQFYYVPLLDS